MVAGVVAVATAGGAYWVTGARRVPSPAPPVTPLAPTVTAQVRGGQAAQTQGVREDFSLEFAEQRTYSDGRTVASDLTVHVANRGGRNFVVSGKEGTIGANQASVLMTGDVVLKASDGLVAKTDSASYADGEGIVRAPGPVAFTRGRTTGSGVGFTYDKNRDTIWVLDKAVVHVAGAGADSMDVRSGAFGEARTDRYMRLERDVRVTRPAQTITADDAMVYLLPEVDEPDRIELRGNGAITGGEGMGNLRAMKARDINLDYAEDGRTLQHATLAGEATITLAGATPSQPGQRLAAEWVDLSLGPDGAITSLVARERLQVTLPGQTGEPARTIRAAELTGDGAAGAGLTAMRFTGGVEFREGGTARTPPSRLATSTALTLALTPAGGADRATFIGNARFEDGTLRAAAAEARYFITGDRLELSGADGAAPPSVTDTGLQIDATAIVIGLATNAVTATGEVSSVMQPAAARSGEGAARTPALLDGGQPLVASAAALEYDTQTRRATYTGRARLWQGDTNIRAEQIVLDEQSGDLSASGGVTSTLALQSTAPDAGTRGTIARGDEMRYDDAARTVTYTKGAQVNGPQGDLTADRIALVLATPGRTLERIEGYGSVITRVAARDARGGRLTYHAADERYVLTGAPVQFTEECRVTSGRTLTFFGAAGKLIVDGNDATRTVTTGGGRCSPPPP
jgi:lipopolysaccharide export system protein LptA